VLPLGGIKEKVLAAKRGGVHEVSLPAENELNVRAHLKSEMRLDTLQKIKLAIDGLTPQQMEELYVWLEQHHPQPIDAQLQADLDAGRIDDCINRALADHKAGNRQPL
jgi:hypothetical protein